MSYSFEFVKQILSTLKDFDVLKTGYEKPKSVEGLGINFTFCTDNFTTAISINRHDTKICVAYLVQYDRNRTNDDIRIYNDSKLLYILNEYGWVNFNNMEYEPLPDNEIDFFQYSLIEEEMPFSFKELCELKRLVSEVNYSIEIYADRDTTEWKS